MKMDSTFSILHFLETHLGNKHFVYYHNNKAVNKNRVYYCPNWKHTMNYKDSNNITASFIEIVSPTVTTYGDDGGTAERDMPTS